MEWTGTRIHPNANSAPALWREAVFEWMCSLRLRAMCTLEKQDSNYTSRCIESDSESSWTHRNSNGGGLFQLDYMLVSGKVLGIAGVVRGGFDLGSDHWPIDPFLRLEQTESWGTLCQDEF